MQLVDVQNNPVQTQKTQELHFTAIHLYYPYHWSPSIKNQLLSFVGNCFKEMRDYCSNSNSDVP